MKTLSFRSEESGKKDLSRAQTMFNERLEQSLASIRFCGQTSKQFIDCSGRIELRMFDTSLWEQDVCCCLTGVPGQTTSYFGLQYVAAAVTDGASGMQCRWKRGVLSR